MDSTEGFHAANAAGAYFFRSKPSGKQ